MNKTLILTLLKLFLHIPETEFINDYGWKRSKESSVKFFLTVMHLPSVFDYFIEIVKQAPTAQNAPLLDAIYTKLLSQEYESKINPTVRFSKAQLETMLETICQWFLDFGYQPEGYRSIYYCNNPLAKEWLTTKMEDTKWLKQFARISTFYDPLDVELKEALESGLEFIEQEKNDIYLEFKDEKSQKFWCIEFYHDVHIVKYGKLGTEGKKTEKQFKDTETCLKAGLKLIESKLKKGYEKVEKFYF